MNLAAMTTLVISKRWTFREVRRTSGRWRNLSIYMFASTKHDGLHFEYLNIRSIYICMLNSGARSPWKTVTISLALVTSIDFSFFWTTLSRCEHKDDNTSGKVEAPFFEPLRPRATYSSGKMALVSSVIVVISPLQPISCIWLD